MPSPESWSQKTPEKKERELNEGSYRVLLGTYGRLFKQIGDLRRSPKAEFDERTREMIQSLDRKRHELHLQLHETGAKIEKNPGAVLVDIVQEQGSLSDYGLPEFSIMTGWEYDPKAPQDRCLLLFDISDVRSDEEETTLEVGVPDDYRVRQARAAALAERVHGKLENDFNSKYFHDTSKLYLGVIIPKDALEEVASVIRDEPEKYRVGAEFYSPEEQALVERFKTEKKDGWIDEKPLLRGKET